MTKSIGCAFLIIGISGIIITDLDKFFVSILLLSFLIFNKKILGKEKVYGIFSYVTIVILFFSLSIIDFYDIFNEYRLYIGITYLFIYIFSIVVFSKYIKKLILV